MRQIQSNQDSLSRDRIPKRGKFSLIALFILLFSVIETTAATLILYEHGAPTNREQYMLELINCFRANPAAAGIRLYQETAEYAQDMRDKNPSFFTNLRKEFASYPKAPPLAFNPKLLKSTQLYSREMTEKGIFSHYGYGSSPKGRAFTQGYLGRGISENISNTGADNAQDIEENVFGFLVDANNQFHATMPLGHRLNALDPKWNEVGIGVFGSRDKGRVTQDFGISKTPYCLGVVYEDKNGNQFYDPGEGIAGVEVRPSVGKYYAITSSSGGYAIPLEIPGNGQKRMSIILTVSRGGLRGIRQEQVTISHQNLKVDFVINPNIQVEESHSPKETINPEKKISSEEWVDSPVTSWSDAVGHGTRWKSLDWFGHYYQSSTGWILHEELGWLYPTRGEGASVWFWHPKLGWLWTGENIFPFLYWNNWNSWLWHPAKTGDSFFFFDDFKGNWILFDSTR